MGAFASNSAENAWCASTGADAISRPATAMAAANVVRMGISPFSKPSAWRLAEVSVEELLGELHTLVLEHSNVLFEPPVERHPDLPRPRENFGILDGRLVVHRIGTRARVALDDV